MKRTISRPIANEDDPREKATRGRAPARRAFGATRSFVILFFDDIRETPLGTRESLRPRARVPHRLERHPRDASKHLLRVRRHLRRERVRVPPGPQHRFEPLAKRPRLRRAGHVDWRIAKRERRFDGSRSSSTHRDGNPEHDERSAAIRSVVAERDRGVAESRARTAAASE